MVGEMKKTWTKEEFIEECNKRVLKDPKLAAAMRCKKHCKRYRHMERKAMQKKRGPKDA